MKPRLSFRFLPLAVLIWACQGSTGGARFRFQVAAAGPDADPAEIGEFINRLGFDVTLSRAVLHIGAIYLNRNPNIGTANDQFGCYGGGEEVGQVLGGLDINLLSRDLQPFPVLGEGTALPARAAAIWLTGAEALDVVNSSQVIFDVAGVAQRMNHSYPFRGGLTIGGQKYVIPPGNPATPGVNPICKERIVAPVPVGFLLNDGGSLAVRVDPYDLLAGVDFSTLNNGALFTEALTLAERSVYGQLTTPGIYNVSWKSQ